MEDYDTYIDKVAECLDVTTFNHQELKIIEECFDRKFEARIAANLINTHWKFEEEDYNNHGDFD